MTAAPASSPAWARSAMVATSNRLAVEAALWALGEGGGAVDAAVAADAVLGPPTLLRQLLSATPSL